MTSKFKLWTFDDAHNWGSQLAAAANERGHEARLFDDPRAPDQGFAFMHMHYHPTVRTQHKRGMAIMSMNPHLTLIPSYRMSVLYDDKAEQTRQFAKAMPRTHIVYTPNGARNLLNTMSLPFVSKSAEGSSSSNIRFIETLDEAKQEIRLAFSDIGIKCRHGLSQRGYLLWQEYLPDNNGDVRVLAIGNLRLMLKRNNRGNMPVANGNEFEPVASIQPGSPMSFAFDFANDLFRREGIMWGGVDIVYDKAKGCWRLLEITVAWTMHHYTECAFIDMSGHATKIKGESVWSTLVSELETGSFGHYA